MPADQESDSGPRKQKVTLWVEVSADRAPLSTEYAIVVQRELDVYVTDWEVEDA